MNLAKVSANGQVMVPAEIRKNLTLRKATRFFLSAMTVRL
jgi:bifunctional DNA-binding transcriptional regulator/antitoxin component of YhaV-PrlF toxin-antitoxin module